MLAEASTQELNSPDAVYDKPPAWTGLFACAATKGRFNTDCDLFIAAGCLLTSSLPLRIRQRYEFVSAIGDQNG